MWKFAVDWKDTAKTTLTGPEKIGVAPYRYLCGGQLTNCMPQPVRTALIAKLEN